MKKIIFLTIIFLLTINLALADFDFTSIKSTLLNQDPDPAEPGEYVELRWKIEKRGNLEVENLTFELDINYPFFFDKIDTSTKKLGDWKGFSEDKEYYTLFYKIRVDDNAIKGTYPVKLKYSYNDKKVIHKEEYDIRVSDRESSKFVIGKTTTSPRKILNDLDEVEFEVELINIGDGSANNVKAVLNLIDGFTPSYNYANEFIVGKLESNERKSALYYLDIDENVKSDNYKTNITIFYSEENNENKIEYKNTTIPFEIMIMNKPEFEITSIETIPTQIISGKQTTLNLNVKNTGKDAESVSIRIFKDSSQPFEFDERTDFIGKLNTNEEGQAVLRFNVDENAVSKKHILTIEIRSVVGNEVFIEQKRIPITLNEFKSDNNLTMIIFVIVLLIIFLSLSAFAGYNSAIKKNKE
ncbi:MAG: COG1361 S-layer family protein [Nanoarchaeota archaeon]